MWQVLQRKAAFIGQVMHGRLDTREIREVREVALSFSKVKALATGNPLLRDKAVLCNARTPRMKLSTPPSPAIMMAAR